jgi:hypothetical protein
VLLPHSLIEAVVVGIHVAADAPFRAVVEEDSIDMAVSVLKTYGPLKAEFLRTFPPLG